LRLRDRIFGLFGREARSEEAGSRKRGPATHVVILDGTMSSLEAGMETNAGMTFKLLREAGLKANLTSITRRVSNGGIGRAPGV
jgi:hypothetical protein